MKALTKDRVGCKLPQWPQCSDPYKLGCRRQSTGAMLGQTYDKLSDSFKSIMIYLCSECGWWNCDWDWEGSLEGPFL